MPPKQPLPVSRRPSRLWAALHRSILLCSALSLTACLGTTETPALKVEVPVIANRAAPAELTMPCARRPLRPAIFLTDKEALTWALKWGYAGDACRALSDRQGEWISTPP